MRVLTFLFLVVLIAGCSPLAQQSAVLNVGIILGSGGLGDRSFNDSAYAGLLEAQKKHNIRFETINFTNQESNLGALRLLARNNYDLLIGIGFENQETVVKLAGEFPGIRFAMIDVEAPGQNIASVVYREHEADFLMGVLAAMLTKTKKVGIITGMDSAAIRRIESGFKQGVAHQDSSVAILSAVAGTFSEPAVGKKLALSQFNDGVDIIHNAAGRTGLGIIEAAQETGKLTSGTSGDQRYLAPGSVVGNRPKRVDTAIMVLIEEIKSGKFVSGTRSLGLKENGITLGPLDESLVTRPILTRLEDLRQAIINGQIAIRVE